MLAVACAEGSQQGPLDEGTLTGGGTGATVGGGGAAAGSVGVSGGGTGVKPSGGSSAGTAGPGGSAGAGGLPSAGAGGDMAGSGGMAGGGMAGSGGMAGGGMGGMSGSGGAAPTGHRYARFVAKSEQNGNVWSAVAELKLFTTGNTQISPANWDITADSEETDDQSAPATAAIDNDTATFWHSAWEPEGTNDAPLPHQLTIDLGTTQPITGFSYLPRQDLVNGRVLAWEFFLSKDGTNWGAAVKTGTFPAGTAVQVVSF